MIAMLMAAEPTMVLPKIAEWTVMDYSTFAQHHSTINKVAERADIVQHNQHGGACRQQLAQHVCEHPLMLEINPRRGLIQHEEVWLTGKCPRNQHPLLLTAGQRGNVHVELFGQANQRDGITYRLVVRRSQRSEKPSARQPAGCDNLLHLRSAEQRYRALRNVADARPLPEAAQG
jgi:hypothetical protein